MSVGWIIMSELFTSSSFKTWLRKRKKGGLVHHSNIYRKENEPIKSRLIRTVIKDLQELTPPQMKHELRIDTEIIRQPKSRRVLFPIIRKLLTKPNQHPIQPPQNIRRIINLRLEHRNPRHQNSRCFLVKRSSNTGRARFCKVSSNGSDTQALLPRGMLVVRDELDEASRALLEGLTGGCDDFEIDGGGGAWG